MNSIVPWFYMRDLVIREISGADPNKTKKRSMNLERCHILFASPTAMNLGLNFTCTRTCPLTLGGILSCIFLIKLARPD